MFINDTDSVSLRHGEDSRDSLDSSTMNGLLDNASQVKPTNVSSSVTTSPLNSLFSTPSVSPSLSYCSPPVGRVPTFDMFHILPPPNTSSRPRSLSDLIHSDSESSLSLIGMENHFPDLSNARKAAPSIEGPPFALYYDPTFLPYLPYLDPRYPAPCIPQISVESRIPFVPVDTSIAHKHSCVYHPFKQATVACVETERTFCSDICLKRGYEQYMKHKTTNLREPDEVKRQIWKKRADIQVARYYLNSLGQRREIMWNLNRARDHPHLNPPQSYESFSTNKPCNMGNPVTLD